jgi:subtilisin-like proprotein convertase family protein
MVDAGAAVTMAKTYTAGAFGALGDTGVLSSGTLAQAIPDNSITGTSSTISVSTGMTFTEAVQISVTATHPFTGDLAIELTGPAGTVKTRSVLKTGDDGFFNSQNLGSATGGMVLLSNAFYGENPAGSWTLKVVDVHAGPGVVVGTLTNWTLRIYGH